jgi:hypothetical protein
MSECRGEGCDHPDCTSTHDGNQSPIAKYDGSGRHIRFNDPRLGNRAARRAAQRQGKRRRP